MQNLQNMKNREKEDISDGSARQGMRMIDRTAKSPDQKFWMDCKKDKIGNFERGCLESNHRKVTDFGLLQDFERMIMTIGSRVDDMQFIMFCLKSSHKNTGKSAFPVYIIFEIYQETKERINEYV